MQAYFSICACFLALQLSAQNPASPPKLTVVVVQGEGAINNVSQRLTREPIVQVEDENRKPVSGAVVTFLLPNHGASGTFLDGSRTLITTTDESGQATARGMQANKLAGKLQIRVTASFQGQTGTVAINQVNALTAAAGAAGGAAGGSAGAGSAAGGAAAAAGMGKIIAIVAIVAAAAVGGGLAAASGGGSSGSAPPSAAPVVPPTTTILPGPIVVGPPR